MISAVQRSSRTIPPRYAKRSERISGAIRGLRSLVLKIRCTTTLPQVCATFLSPLQGLSLRLHHYPGLAPWAAIYRRFAANRLWRRRLREGCDGYHNAAQSYFLVPEMVRDPRHGSGPAFLVPTEQARETLNSGQEERWASKLQPGRGECFTWLALAIIDRSDAMLAPYAQARLRDASIRANESLA
jgi:hypothetical protein